MTLRTYFDSALKKGASAESAEQRKTALGTTVRKGEEAARHLEQAQGSLKKLEARQEQRRKEKARA